MTTTDLDDEIRSLLEDIGDAAGLPSDIDGIVRSNRHVRRPGRPVTLVAGAFAAAGVLGVAGAVVFREVDPAASDPVCAPNHGRVAADAPDAVDDGAMAERVPRALRETLPPGFVALLGSRNPLEAVAYNAQGVRMAVSIDLNNSEGAATGIPQDDNYLLTADGDGVVGEVSYGTDFRPGARPAVVAELARDELPAVVAAVAAAFTGETRTAFSTRHTLCSTANSSAPISTPRWHQYSARASRIGYLVPPISSSGSAMRNAGCGSTRCDRRTHCPTE